jgi:phosphatidylglycerophosphatase C
LTPGLRCSEAAIANLALFDFDGTITTREMFADFVRFAVPRRRRIAGNVLFLPMYLGYRLGLISGNRIRASLVRFGFRGISAQELRAAGRKFCSERLPAVIRPDALARIRWHLAQGDKVVVVSGALDVYFERWCGDHGLELLASRLQVLNEVMTGRYREAQCVAEEKRRRICERYDLSTFGHVYAYGDTRDDLPMLELAQTRFFRGRQLER